MARHTPEQWTDDGPHDPGVTVLDLVAYTIVDVAAGLDRRIRATRCGWRCRVALVAGAASAAGAVLLAQRRRLEVPE